MSTVRAGRVEPWSCRESAGNRHSANVLLEVLPMEELNSRIEIGERTVVVNVVAPNLLE